MSSSPPRKGRRRLVRELLAAYESLSRWDISLRRSVESDHGRKDSPLDPRALLTLLENALKALAVRLNELGVEEFTSPSTSPFPRTDEEHSGSPSRLYLTACQACGRALGSAFLEAQAVADGASSRMIYGSLREFEKQIWVLDPRQVGM
jgi:hypothetical protein